MRIFTLIAACAALFAAQAVYAGKPVPVALGPIAHADAELVIVSPDGAETRYTPAEIETFTTYKMTTTTPWRENAAEFEGVLLSDLLNAHGLGNEPAVRVTAENDYSTVLSRDLLDTVEILVATRVDGQPHSRRARGPIQFIIDAEVYATSPFVAESNFVWMAARIEASD